MKIYRAPSKYVDKHVHFNERVHKRCATLEELAGESNLLQVHVRATIKVRARVQDIYTLHIDIILLLFRNFCACTFRVVNPGGGGGEGGKGANDWQLRQMDRRVSVVCGGKLLVAKQ